MRRHDFILNALLLLGLARDGFFGRRGDRQFFSTVGAVLVGQAGLLSISLLCIPLIC